MHKPCYLVCIDQEKAVLQKASLQKVSITKGIGNKYNGSQKVPF